MNSVNLTSNEADSTLPENLLFSESNRATYSPEDNKLRLYVGRVPRDEYERLRADGWTSTPKQSCDFVAHWTPSRRDTCLAYAGIIEDEDQSPEDRAADRAERFGGYRDKRLGEATGHADRYEAGPSAHGYQSEHRAECAAARHDRIAGHACDAWSKAEYWQRRTAGVISHALYKSTPAVRMGRIKEIEADLRKRRAEFEKWGKEYSIWEELSKIEDAEDQTRRVLRFAGATSCSYGYSFKHPRQETVGNAHIRESGSDLHTLMTLVEREYGTENLTGGEACALFLARYKKPATEDDWSRHYALRLAYENQMLEAQGGRAAFVEMEVGGWLGSFQIRKVNKSPATGRVVSVQVLAPSRYSDDGKAPVLRTINIERLASEVYRAPSDEDRAALAATRKAEKAAAPKKDPCPLVNPTDDDAERLQEALNERAKADHCARHRKAYGKDYAEELKPSTVCRITQAQYSAVSKGGYARAETRGLCRNAELEPRASNMYSSHERTEAARRGPKVCEIRTTGSDGSDYGARRVIILTDKPQKPLPSAVWSLPKPVAEAVNA